MLRREDLPEDAEDWSSIEVELDPLPPEQQRCPVELSEVVDYVRRESADTDAASAERLEFVRHARLGEARAWLWRYTESDGTACYVSVHIDADGTSVLGLCEPNGLSPEQFLLAEHYDEVYWS